MSDTKDGKNRPHDDEIQSISSGEEITQVSSDNEPADEKMAGLKSELDQAKRDFLYLRADFDNYKKSVIKERSELIKYGCERVFVEALGVLDNFDRALELELSPDNLASFKEGLLLTASEFKKVLENFGVREIDSQGVAFDPNIHEALSSEETDSLPPGHVFRVFKKAYKLHDRVIRPAQVVVAKEPKKSEG